MKRFRTWISLLLIGSMLFLQGCSAGENVSSGASGENQDKSASSGEAENQVSMGRYAETELTFPEEIQTVNYPDGSIQLLDSKEVAVAEKVTGSIYTTSDKGQTWTRKEMAGLTELLDRASYISDIALAPDGSAAVIYTEDSVEQETESGELSDYEYHPKYCYISPDGTATELAFPDPENYIYKFAFGNDSRLYAFSLGGKAYEADHADGSFRQLFENEGVVDSVCFTGTYMVLFDSRCGVVIYDLENESVAENDAVLEQFIEDEIGDAMGTNSDGCSVASFGGEQDNVIYLAFEKGLYRHVIGGSSMEQVMDGSLNSLGDPQTYLRGMICLPDNEFMILYGGMKLCHYVYDDSIPTVPTEQVSIYSLKEDASIRQAASLFQKAHPDTYVRYEVGLDGDSAKTQEDAIKNLNTRMMSGEGPDLLVLDGLPMDSYVEKGVLADVSGTVDGFTGEDSLFPNLVDAFRQDGKIYMLPVGFCLPLIEGDEETVKNVSDLASLADAAESLREKNPEGNLTGLMTEEEVLCTLGLVSASAWTDADGSVDQDALRDFLEQARRIYQAEIKGVDAADLAAYKDSEERWSQNVSGDGNYYANASASALDIAMGSQLVGIGILSQADFDFNMVTTVADQKEDFSYGIWQGQVKDCFIPRTMVGVSAASSEKDLTLEFFRFLFERELQDMSQSANGFPVNKASFDALKDNPRPDEQAGGIALSTEEGDFFSLDLRWMSEEDFAYLKKQAESAVNPCINSGAIVDAVCEIGPKALNESVSVDEAVAEIVKRAAIYVAE